MELDDLYFMNQALLEAEKSLEKSEVPVGAVIVVNQKIIGRGHNLIEKLQDVDGRLGYFNLAPIVEKTFNIMGLTKYSTVFQSEEEALEGMS